MRDEDKKGANVVHVSVHVTQSGSTFNAVYDPPVVPVKHNNATIRFRIDSKTASDIEIDSVTVPPSAQDQFGTPEISSNGKQVDILDKNTVKELVHLTFAYKSSGSSAMAFKGGDGEQTDDFPQIDNNPPG